jgi:hypothetical protein
MSMIGIDHEIESESLQIIGEANDINENGMESDNCASTEEYSDYYDNDETSVKIDENDIINCSHGNVETTIEAYNCFTNCVKSSNSTKIKFNRIKIKINEEIDENFLYEGINHKCFESAFLVVFESKIGSKGSMIFWKDIKKRFFALNLTIGCDENLITNYCQNFISNEIIRHRSGKF